MNDLRIRLIERLCRLPDAGLARVAALLDQLESDGASIENQRLPSEIPVAFAGPQKDWPHAPVQRLSDLSRLNYVHNNAVKHGLVRRANEYPWCSAAWFERTATRAQVKTIYGFKMDRLKIDDDYEPIVEGQ